MTRRIVGLIAATDVERAAQCNRMDQNTCARLLGAVDCSHASQAIPVRLFKNFDGQSRTAFMLRFVNTG